MFNGKPRAEIEALEPQRLPLLGDESLDGERHIWSNLVSDSPERTK